MTSPCTPSIFASARRLAAAALLAVATSLSFGAGADASEARAAAVRQAPTTLATADAAASLICAAPTSAAAGYPAAIARLADLSDASGDRAALRMSGKAPAKGYQQLAACNLGCARSCRQRYRCSRAPNPSACYRARSRCIRRCGC